MSLANGRPYIAQPGPSVLPDRVLAAMQRGSPNIYGGSLHDMVATLWSDLRAVARTKGHVAIYIGNGHAAWEAANTNMFSQGDKALVLITGNFGTGWANAARGIGIDVTAIDFGKRAAADPARLAQALAEDKAHSIKAVLVTHVDTATSVRNDIAALRAAIDSVGHPALLAVDAIASLGCDQVEMDAWGVDVMIAASQKGLMTPPGLAFVWLSDKALAQGRGADRRTPYWDWTPRVTGSEFWQYFHGTAPTHHLYALREALTMIAEEGLEAVWARHERLAQAVWAAIEIWGSAGPMAMNVADPACRGRSVTGVRIGAPHGTALRHWCEQKAGVTLGIGLGMVADDDPEWHGFFRMAHMGHVNAHMTLGMLGVVQAGLLALDIPHGKGALEAAARVVAGA